MLNQENILLVKYNNMEALTDSLEQVIDKSIDKYIDFIDRKINNSKKNCIYNYYYDLFLKLPACILGEIKNTNKFLFKYNYNNIYYLISNNKQYILTQVGMQNYLPIDKINCNITSRYLQLSVKLTEEISLSDNYLLYIDLEDNNILFALKYLLLNNNSKIIINNTEYKLNNTDLRIESSYDHNGIIANRLLLNSSIFQKFVSINILTNKQDIFTKEFKVILELSNNNNLTNGLEKYKEIFFKFNRLCLLNLFAINSDNIDYKIYKSHYKVYFDDKLAKININKILSVYYLENYVQTNILPAYFINNNTTQDHYFFYGENIIEIFLNKILAKKLNINIKILGSQHIDDNINFNKIKLLNYSDLNNNIEIDILNSERFAINPITADDFFYIIQSVKFNKNKFEFFVEKTSGFYKIINNKNSFNKFSLEFFYKYINKIFNNIKQ